MLAFWILLTILLFVAIIVSFPEATLQTVIKLKQWLHRRCARKYGQVIADKRVPLHPWETTPWECNLHPEGQSRTHKQFYAWAWRGFILLALGLAPYSKEWNLSRWDFFKMAVAGLLMDLGIAHPRPGK